MKIFVSSFFLLINVPGGAIVAFQPTTTITSPTSSISSAILLNQRNSDAIRNVSIPHYQQQSRNRFLGLYRNSKKGGVSRDQITLMMAGQSPLTEMEVRKGIDKVVSALRRDSRANQELGKLQRVTIILGSGLQQMDTILAVRFNAAFQKSGPGMSSIPLPFGLGQSNVSEGRGTMVGQVKASVNVKTGKVISCSVFRDLGYGRTFDLKV